MNIHIAATLKSRVLLPMAGAALFAISLFQSCSEGNKDHKATIGENGNVREIIIPKNADDIIKFAASELQFYFKKITGKELPVSASGDNTSYGAIRLVIEDTKEIKWDGYSIEIGKKGITLSSKESRGLLYGAYTLLGKAGCSFFYPGEKEEIIPSHSFVDFTPNSHIYNPVLEHRGLALYGLQANSVELGRNMISWMAKNKMNFILVSENRPSDSDGPAHGTIWKEVSGELLGELQKRGFIIEMSEHCAPVFFPRSLFKDHPDWFALNNGVRKLGEPPYSGQMCYSNKEGVEYYATAIANYAARHPEFHIIGTWPLDGGGYCECDNCKDPETVFRATMRVAEKVKEVRPDMIVEHLAYKTQTWTPPKMDKLPSNMSVLWCPDLGQMDSLVRGWVKKSRQSGGAYQFEYYMGDNYRTCDNVWLRPAYSANISRHANELGFRGVISLFLPMQNWWRSSFNNWFFAQACWDSTFDVPSAISEYCKSYYGSHAPGVEAVFKSIFTELQPEPYSRPIESSKTRLQGVRVSSGKIIKALDSILIQTKEPEITTRLQRLKTYVEYSLIHCEAFASLKPADLDRLVNYSKDHPEQDMVLMYPGYIQWRNEEYFIK
ncbi:MAG: DUF4838 domain-containing protein [Ginsengibacter sp.]